MVAPTPSGHSAAVHLELHAGGERFGLSQFGGDILIFERAVILPGNSGEVIVRIDGEEQRFAARWEESDLAREIVPAICEEIEQPQCEKRLR